ncbi:MAG TPA: VOC family protein [Syntrophomonadaceae bacterium]|nr:VOC family protein [Syntrophomonadaceae bacterium]HOQ09112.1 VOC family protein [Syntrophomonadaceae bacterium]
MRIHHVGICVTDVEKALDFYTRVLGFKQEETINIGGVNYYFVGDGNISIEIEASHNPGSNPHDNGIGHIALAVDDLEAIAEKLRQENVNFLLPPSQFRPDRKIAFIEDPHGIRLQLIQFLE